MFELKVFESEESDDTPRASHARLFWWAVRTVMYLAIWLTLTSVGSAPKPSRATRSYCACSRFPGLWCNSKTGRCGTYTFDQKGRMRPV
jgi:hypothetical protein